MSWTAPFHLQVAAERADHGARMGGTIRSGWYQSPAVDPALPLDTISDAHSLIVLYQRLHDTVHARSGQSSPLKLVYTKTDHEACLAWVSSIATCPNIINRFVQVTRPFELYLALSPRLTKSAAVAAANNVARWVAGEEGKVFLKDAPVF